MVINSFFMDKVGMVISPIVIYRCPINCALEASRTHEETKTNNYEITSTIMFRILMYVGYSILYFRYYAQVYQHCPKIASSESLTTAEMFTYSPGLRINIPKM